MVELSRGGTNKAHQLPRCHRGSPLGILNTQVPAILSCQPCFRESHVIERKPRSPRGITMRNSQRISHQGPGTQEKSSTKMLVGSGPDTNEMPPRKRMPPPRSAGRIWAACKYITELALSPSSLYTQERQIYDLLDFADRSMKRSRLNEQHFRRSLALTDC